MVDAVNSLDNATFVVNTVNIVSNLSDVLITAVGGLLPLLSAATTSSVRLRPVMPIVRAVGRVVIGICLFQGEIDVLEPGYGLSIERSVALLQRALSLADIIIIASNVPLGDLEAEKNMTQGTMLRQCLRTSEHPPPSFPCIDVGTRLSSLCYSHCVIFFVSVQPLLWPCVTAWSVDIGWVQ